MKISLLTCLYLLLTSYSWSQESSSPHDSLITLLAKESADSVKVRQLIHYIDGVTTVDQNELLSLFDRGQSLSRSSLSRSSGDLTILYDLYLAISSKLFYIGERQLAKEHNQKLLNILDTSTRSEPKYYAHAQIQRAGFEIEEDKPQKALNRLDETLLETRALLTPTTRSNIYNSLSVANRKLGKLDLALITADSAVLEIAHTNSRTLANAYSSRGRIYRKLGFNCEAKEDYTDAKHLYIIHQDQTRLSVSYNNLGNIEHISGNYNEAIAFYIKSLNIKKKENNTRGMGIAYHNIGAIKVDMKDWTGAIENFSKSNELAIKLEFKSLMVHNELKVGDVAHEKGNYLEALTHHSKAYSISKEINYSTGIMESLNGLGQDNLKLDKLSEASLQLAEGLTLARTNGSRPYEAAFLISLAQLYMAVADDHPNELAFLNDNAVIQQDGIEKLLLQAKDLSYEMGQTENILEVLKSLHYFYKRNGNHFQDAEIMSDYADLKDSLFSQERTQALTEWETRYATAEKEKEIIQLEADNKIQLIKNQQFQSLLYGSIGSFSLIGLFGYFLITQRNQKKQVIRREIFRSKLSRDLHDDVGSILTGLAMQSELLADYADEKTKGTMEKLAEMSREAMSRMRDTVWAIDAGKDTYLDLVDRMMDFGEDLLGPKDIQLIVENKIDKSEKKFPPQVRQNIYMIYKEAITNIAKHSSCDQVKVTLAKEKNNIQLSIIDNGIITNTKIKTSGLGLSNMKERATGLGGQLKIKTSSNSYEIYVNIPLG